ncbi:hypothetical protein SAMN05443572_112155 [Myxococcus fulvus]|uniref:Uncharacterized protein n=2 Tax=Myxococcus fulvus TaxID=33 RepID=A0A511T9D3_MYXFU|nr:hypothetical protein MFU01_58320 [Myxococcus fulvus]SEU37588.1 hypothetical protein SAMN05443572_112155 [Myxococcus fulvus]
MSSGSPSMRIELRGAHVPGEGNERRPLAALCEEEPHVHGELAWTLGERRVPCMGFWGPDDVCLGQWWDELTRAVAALSDRQPYTLDTCEQGDPAFLFERTDASLYLSIVAGTGGGAPHPEWQNAEFAWDDLGAALRRFKRDLRQLLELSGPPVLPEEWKKRFSEQV